LLHSSLPERDCWSVSGEWGSSKLLSSSWLDPPPEQNRNTMEHHWETTRLGLFPLVRDHPERAPRPRPVDGFTARGEPVTVHLDPCYLAKALAWGFHRIGVIDAVSPVKFHRDHELMIIMPVRASALCSG